MHCDPAGVQFLTNFLSAGVTGALQLQSHLSLDIIIDNFDKFIWTQERV